MKALTPAGRLANRAAQLDQLKDELVNEHKGLDDRHAVTKLRIAEALVHLAQVRQDLAAAVNEAAKLHAATPNDGGPKYEQYSTTIHAIGLGLRRDRRQGGRYKRPQQRPGVDRPGPADRGRDGRGPRMIPPALPHVLSCLDCLLAKPQAIGYPLEGVCTQLRTSGSFCPPESPIPHLCGWVADGVPMPLFLARIARLASLGNLCRAGQGGRPEVRGQRSGQNRRRPASPICNLQFAICNFQSPIFQKPHGAFSVHTPPRGPIEARFS